MSPYWAFAPFKLKRRTHVFLGAGGRRATLSGKHHNGEREFMFKESVVREEESLDTPTPRRFGLASLVPANQRSLVARGGFHIAADDRSQYLVPARIRFPTKSASLICWRCRRRRRQQFLAWSHWRADLQTCGAPALLILGGSAGASNCWGCRNRVV